METPCAIPVPPAYNGHFNDFDISSGLLATVTEERPPSKPRPSAKAKKDKPESVDESDDAEADDNTRSPKRQRTGYNCVHCNMAFTEKRALARHRKTDHHRRQLGLPPDRKHACEVCGKHFTRGHDLKRHQNEQHSDQKTPTGAEGSYASSDCSDPSTVVGESSRKGSNTSDAKGNAKLAAVPEGVAEPAGKALSHASQYALYQDRGDDLRSNGKSLSLSPGSMTSDLRRDSSQVDSKQEQKLKAWKRGAIISPDTSPTTETISERSPDSFKKELDKSPRDDLSQISPFLPDAPSLPASSPRARAPVQSPANTWRPMMCMICEAAFEDEPEDLIIHLRRHLDNFKGKHRCSECSIDFTHAEDLERHLQSAAQGHCGFNFPHECTGHHPPDDMSGTLSDYDRVRLFVQLQHWEQAQLKAYIAEINDLTLMRQVTAGTRWSEVIRRSRPNSFHSFAISINTYASAPCDVTTDGKLDLGGLQKRLQQMSLGRPGSRLLRRISPSSEELPTKLVNKTLQRAVRNGELHKVQRQIDLGGDVSVIHEDQGPFTTVALWGHGYISRRMAEHRVDEDIMGSCSVCHMNSQTFTRPYNKVKSLLKHGASANEPGGLCGFPLATAAWMGKADIVSLLLEHGADLRNASGKYGDALCSVAAGAGYPGHAEVVQLLMDLGADVRSSGPAGNAIEFAKDRRRYWALRLKESKDDEEGEMMSRISCCDQVICALQGASANFDARKAKGNMKKSSARSTLAQNGYGYG